MKTRLQRRGGFGSVAVRAARPEDESSIRRLALLDDRRLPPGPKLIAEADGALVAALAVEHGQAVADPFERTAGIVRMLEARATEVRTGTAG